MIVSNVLLFGMSTLPFRLIQLMIASNLFARCFQFHFLRRLKAEDFTLCSFDHKTAGIELLTTRDRFFGE